jgi:hypothetical protein
MAANKNKRKLRAPKVADSELSRVFTDIYDELNKLSGDLSGATEQRIKITTISQSDLPLNPVFQTVTANTFTGDLTGNVTGNVTGDVTGDLTGAIHVQGKNDSGSTLAKGTPVYISGQVANGQQFTIGVADSDGSGTMPSIGILSADVNNNAMGDVVTHGKLIGIDTSSFTVGDELYISSSGTLTATPPTGESNLLQKIAKVIRVDSTNGQIYIMGAGRTNAVPNLDQGAVFIGDANNQAVASTFSIVNEPSPLGGGSLAYSNGTFTFTPASVPSLTGYVQTISTSATSGLSSNESNGTVTMSLDVNRLTAETTVTSGDFLALSQSGNTKKVTLANIDLNLLNNNNSGFINDYTVTQADVTQHQAALSITESQISDLQSYLTAHPTIGGNAITQNNSGNSFIQDLTFDSNGHVTAVASATASFTDTNHFVSAGSYDASTKDLTLTITGQTDPVIDLTAIDADKLDGQEGSYYLNYNNLNNKPSLNFDNYDHWTLTVGTDSSDISSNDAITLVAGTNVTLNKTGTSVTINSSLPSGAIDTITTSNTSGLSSSESSGEVTLNLALGNLAVATSADASADSIAILEGSNTKKILLSNLPLISDDDFSSNGLMKRTGAGAYGIVTDNSSNWNTAYGWGDHSTEGYLTAHPTISGTRTDQNNSGNSFIQDITFDTNGHVLTVSSSSASFTDTNYYLNGANWATGTGVLTLNVQGATDVTVDLDGRYLTALPSHNHNDLYYTESEVDGFLSGKDNYQSWTISDSTSPTPNSEAITSGSTLKFAGSGATTVAYNPSNNIMTISSTDTNTDTNFYPTNAETSVTSGVITLGGVGMTDVTIDLSSEFLSSLPSHNHDSLYYTKNQVDGFLSGKDNYGSWTISDSVSPTPNTEAITSGSTLKFEGSGATTVQYNPSNNIMTISSTDNNTDTNWYPINADTSVTNGVITLGGVGMTDVTIDLSSEFLTSLPSHNHNDLYYTESEVDGFLGNKDNYESWRLTDGSNTYLIKGKNGSSTANLLFSGTNDATVTVGLVPNTTDQYQVNVDVQTPAGSNYYLNSITGNGNSSALQFDFAGDPNNLASFTHNFSHNHNDLYYTKTEINNAGYLTSIPSEFLTQTEGDARYLKLSGGTISGILNIDNGNSLRLYSPSDAYANADARNSGNGARIHRFNKNSTNTGYLPYYENWYDGSSYHSIGVENDVWQISDGLDVSGKTKVYSAIGASDNVRTGLAHYDTTAMAANVGGQLVLGYKYDTGGSYTEGAILKMYKENGTSGQYGSGLKFQVRNHGANLSTKMILDPSGNVGINTIPSSSYKLDVNGAGHFVNDLILDEDLVVADNIYLSDTNTALLEGGSNSVKIQTDSGYIELGPKNTSYSHIETDRDQFYFNKKLIVNSGVVSSYDEDLQLRRANGSTDKLTIKDNEFEFNLAGATQAKIEPNGKFTLITSTTTKPSINSGASGTEVLTIESGNLNINSSHVYIDNGANVDGDLVVASSITSGSFVKGGGTSSQFLKADGSVDSNTYLTSGSFLPLTGGTLTGNITLGKSDPVLILNDTSASNSTVLTAFTSYRAQGSEKGFVGYGSGSNNYLYVRNSDGRIDIQGSTGIYLNSDTTLSGDLDVTGAIVLEDSQPIKWDTNNILSHNGTSTYLGDAASASTLTLSGGNGTFEGDLSITGGDLTLGTDSIASNINAVGDVLAFKVDSNENSGGTPNMQFKVGAATELTINGSTATFAGDVIAPLFETIGTGYLYLGGHVRLNNPGSGAFKLGQYNGSSWTDTLDITNAGDATFAGNVSMASGNSVGKFAVLSSGVHPSYDLYNNGTSYFNGGVTVDAGFTQSGGAVSSFSGAVNIAGNVHIGDAVQVNSYGAFQVNQTSNVDEEGIAILSASAGRSMRLYVDETNSYINSGNGGNGDLILNEGTGSVGIGTASPVNNTPLTLQAPSGYTDTLWLKSVGTNIASRINIGPTGTGNAQINNATGTNIEFQVSGSEKMRITSGGDVEIGTTTNAATRILTIDSSTVSKINLDVGSEGTVGNFEARSGEVSIGADTAADLHLKTSGTDQVTVDYIGNVGIGTTSPTSKVSITDSATMYAAVDGVLLDIKRNASNGGETTGRVGLRLANNSNGFNIYYGGTTDRLRFVDGGNTEVLSLKNGGNVGIGATNPAQKLVVNGGIHAYGNITTPASGTYGLLMDYYIATSRFWSRGTSGGGTRGGFAFYQLEADGTNQITSFALDTSGNASFNYDLEVDGNASIDYSLLGRGFRSANRGEFHLNSTGTNDVSEIFLGYGDGFTEANIRWGISDRGTSSGKLEFYRGPALGGFSSVMTLDGSNKRVGIGTSSPSTALHIDQPSNNRAGGLYLERNGSNYGLSAFVNSGGYGIIGSNGSFTTDIITMNLNNGNVGIGVSPASKLQVAGTIDVNTASSGLPTIKLSHTNTGADNFEIKAGTTGVTNGGFSIRDTDAAANRFVIDSNGKVGIGTSSPDGALHLDAGTSSDLVIEKDDAGYASVRFHNSGSQVSYIQLDASEDMVHYGGSGVNQIIYAGGSERMRILSSGGITFNGDTATANALDDYEEGTFTPQIHAGASNTSFNSNNYGKYTKIGNVVHCSGRFSVTSITAGSSSTNVELGGLPFAANTPLGTSTGAVAGSIGFASGFAGEAPTMMQIRDGETNAFLYFQNSSLGISNLKGNDFGTGAHSIVFQITYHV